MEGHPSLHLPCPNLARRATPAVCPRWGEVISGGTRLMLWLTSQHGQPPPVTPPSVTSSPSGYFPEALSPSCVR